MFDRRSSIADALLGHVPDRRYKFFTESVENVVEKYRRESRIPHSPCGFIALHHHGARALTNRTAHYTEGVLRFAVPVVFLPGLAPTVRSARVVAIIPARYQSTRLPGKALALIGGRPMIEHVYRRTLDARRVNAVLVATDDERIARAVDDCGGTVVMTSPDHTTGTDRLAEVARHLDGEIIVNVQGDEPLVEPSTIDAVIAHLTAEPELPMATLRCRIADEEEFQNPAVVKVVVDGAEDALYFSRAPVPFTRPGHAAPAAWRHIGLYAYRRTFLLEVAALTPTPLERAEGLEQLRVLEHGFRIGTVETTSESIGVDTPEDLERVRRLVEAGAPR
jgi:3-deoxy-manno-octulosonate cytidylyltransferase (CMP-KDO synthetase)